MLPDRFVLFDVQANGDKVLVADFATFVAAQIASSSWAYSSIELVTAIGTMVLTQP
jgi:hypothetical protein